MRMIDAICELLKVKSIITLAIIGAMVFMAVTERIDAATFMTVAGSVVTYYFTRKEGNDTKSRRLK